MLPGVVRRVWGAPCEAAFPCASGAAFAVPRPAGDCSDWARTLAGKPSGRIDSVSQNKLRAPSENTRADTSNLIHECVFAEFPARPEKPFFRLPALLPHRRHNCAPSIGGFDFPGDGLAQFIGKLDAQSPGKDACRVYAFYLSPKRLCVSRLLPLNQLRGHDIGDAQAPETPKTAATHTETFSPRPPRRALRRRT